MDSDNSSMDGEVDTHWRESLDTKDKNEEQFSGKGPKMEYLCPALTLFLQNALILIPIPTGKGPKSPPENNDLEATSPVSSQGSPRSQSPSGYNSDTKQPHTPGTEPNEKGEQNGDHDADDRLSLSPPPEDRPQSPENRESRSPSPTINHNQNHHSPPDDNTRSHPASPKSPAGSPANNAHSPDKEEEDGVDNAHKVNKSLAEDLSDVSDIESDGGDDDILNAEDEEEEEKDERDSDGEGKRGRSKMNGGVTMSLAVTDEEQLDFDEDPTDETNLPGAGTMEREEGEDEDGELPGDKPNTGGKGRREINRTREVVQMEERKEEEEEEEGKS
uniref:Uncharacterized protein n=1 Tax=Cacopsylla melanoneura TaxID=428564 RepID=A0A8D8LSA8_9HEMI